MAEVSRPLDNDDFHTMAHDVHRMFDKGVGTSHAKVRLVRDVLSNLATVNFKAGFQEGHAKGVFDASNATSIKEGTRPVPVPETLHAPPDVAFDVRDLHGAAVLRVMLNGQVLLLGQSVTDGNQVVHALSQIGLQMAGAARAAGGVG